MLKQTLDEESQLSKEVDAGCDAGNDDGATNKATHDTHTNPQQTEDGGTTAPLALPSPHSAATFRSSHYAFLQSLSKNPNYKRLLLPLFAAQVSILIYWNCRI